MRVLLLCERYPDSYRDGLLLRILHLLKHLAKNHRFDLLCQHGGVADGEPPKLFDHIWTAPAPPVRAGQGWRGLFAGWDARDLYQRNPEIVRLLQEEIDPTNYDVVWDAGARMLMNLPDRWSGVPVVAELVDDMVLTIGRAARKTPWSLQRLRLMKYSTVHRRYERDCLQRAAVCCVVSDDDAASFRSVSRVPVRVARNGVDAEFFAPGAEPEIPGRLVFEGSMSFGPNLSAAIFLVEQVMPLVWSRRPDASVVLVGRDPPPKLLALENERVLVTGSVDDVRPFVRQAQVFMCPLLDGAGIKNKLLQAFSMGKAVVATPVSVGGLGAQDGTHLLVRDSAPALAEAALRLLDDAALRARLGGAARTLVHETLTWPVQAIAFEAVLVEAAGQAVRR
jgi:glycosyltransferase involved in cell wall biosynthesis